MTLPIYVKEKFMKKTSIILCIVLVLLTIIKPVEVRATFSQKASNGDITSNDPEYDITVATGGSLRTLTYSASGGALNVINHSKITKLVTKKNCTVNITGPGTIGTIDCQGSPTVLTTDKLGKIGNLSISQKNTTVTTKNANIVTVTLKQPATLDAQDTEADNIVVEASAMDSTIILKNSAINDISAKTSVKLVSNGVSGIGNNPPVINKILSYKEINYSGKDEDSWSQPIKISRVDETSLTEGMVIVRGTDNPSKWQITNDGWRLKKGANAEKTLVLESTPSGMGSETSPYLITNTDDLTWFAKEVNSGNTDIHAKLTTDINLNQGTSFDFNSEMGLVKVTDGSNTAYLGTGIKGTSTFKETASIAGKWYDETGNDGTYAGKLQSLTPIGVTDNTFEGSFDGNSHTISGLYNNNGNTNNIGLFGDISEKAIIKNLAVKAGYIYGNDCVSDICAKNAGTIMNCYSYTTGCVTGKSNAGIICGSNTGTITNSYYLGTDSNGMIKTADDFASGLVTRLLNGGDGKTERATGTWGQTLGTDIYPVKADKVDGPQTNAVYKVTYTGAFEGNEYVNYGDNATLEEKYNYSIKDGTLFTGENITEDISITTVANPKHNISLTSRIDSVVDSTTVALLTGGGEFYENKSVTVVAPEKEGYKFKGWYTADTDPGNEQGYSGDAVSNSLSYNFKLTEDTYLVAVYTANADVTMNITGNNFTVNNGAKQTTGSYRQAFKAGTKIKLRATEENFAYWMNNSSKIVSTSPEYEFVLVGNTTYTAVYKAVEENSAFVEFVSVYGQILQSAVYLASNDIVQPDGPSRIGFEFTGWNMSVEKIKMAIANGEKYIKVTPVYKASITKHKVTVNYVGLNSETPEVYDNLAIGSTKTVTAKAIEGKKFSHWASDVGGTLILATSESYTVAMSKDIELYAIYVDEEETIDKKPVMAITDTYTSVLGAKNKIAFCATRDVPEGYTVHEQGILFGKDSSFTKDSMIVGGTNVGQYLSSSPVENKVVILNVNVGEAKDTVVYARGYLIVKNNATGNMETYYSDITSGSFNQVLEGE